jgi:hypothetical protein
MEKWNQKNVKECGEYKKLRFVELVTHSFIHSFIHSFSQSVSHSASKPDSLSVTRFLPTVQCNIPTAQYLTEPITFLSVTLLICNSSTDKIIPSSPCVNTIGCYIAVKGNGKKGKYHARTDHEGLQREKRYRSTLSLTSVLEGVR